MTENMSDLQARRTRPSVARLPWASVELTPIEETDLDLIHGWQNDPALRDLTMGFRLPLQKETVRDWLQGLRSPAQQQARVVYAVRHEERAIGIAQLFGMTPFQRRAELGVFLSDLGSRAVGIGFIAGSLLIDFGFNGLDLRKIGAEVLTMNTATIKVCERIGFVREGVKRQEYFADGACWDTQILGLLREEFSVRLPPEARRLCRSLSPRPTASSGG